MHSSGRRAGEGMLIGIGAGVLVLAASLRGPLSPGMRDRALLLASGLGAVAGAILGTVAAICEGHKRSRDPFVGRLTGSAIGFVVGCLLGSLPGPARRPGGVPVGAICGALRGEITERRSGRLTLGKILVAIAVIAVVIAASRVVGN